MSKKMLINALHAEEARVAIVEDGRLVDLDVEIAGNEQIRGNIYKGVVVRVEPGLQAAFVDIGLKKLGFLQMGELHPENWKWRDEVPEDQRHRRPRIQEVLRRGQELIVQVEKGERDNKGSALTTYASLPGRYMVLMPGSDSSGISRKVEAEGERKKLKEIISEMTIPEGYGYIIRTEAMGRSREELQKDLDSLISLYEGIVAQGNAMKGAGPIYQESALIIRTIRDYFSADIDEVLVDSKDVYRDVRECLKEIDPQFEKLVKMHQEKRPIFSRYQLEEQIDLIYEKKVPLKSGGSIFIEPTEALVSIDVNSGKSTGEKGVEDTAFKTNMEAAEEAARQLRLRDLGGLIVIDFIDMRDRKHNAEVEKTLKSALKADKARVNVSRISEFGLLEMSRQRIRQTLNQASTLECPHCDGRGKVKSVEAMALSFLRKVHAAAAKGTIGEVVGSLPLEVAYYLLNRKRHELSQIESDYDIEVTVKGKPSFLLNQMELELVKREKLPETEMPQERAQQRPFAREESVSSEDAGKKKKKGKGKPQAEVEAAAPVIEVAPVPQAVEPAVEERPATVEGEVDEHKKKRRRKRKRGKGNSAEGAGGGEFPADLLGEEGSELPAQTSAPVQEETAADESAGEQAAGLTAEESGEEGKKKRRRKRRRGGKSAQDAESGEAEAEFAQQETVEATHEGAPVTDAVVAETVTPVVVESVTSAAVESVPSATEKRKPGRPPRAKKQQEQTAVPPAAEISVPALVVEPVEPAEPVKAKKGGGRGGRPAKSAAPVEVGAVVAVTDAIEVADLGEAVKPARAAKAAKPAKPAKDVKETKEVKDAKAAKAPKLAEPAKAPKAGKSKAPKAEEGEAINGAAAEPAQAATKKRTPKKKDQAVAEPKAVEPSASKAGELPKKERAPRKKKDETPDR